MTTDTSPRERPILFSGPMVRALLDGRKTQTRRIVKGMALEWLAPDMFTPEFVADPANHLCPYGVPGDVLWVRETLKRAPHLWTYAADGMEVDWPARQGLAGKARDTVVSIHMPRDACRLRLRITDVRVERLNDISEADALAEGIDRVANNFGNGPAYCDYLLPDVRNEAEWYASPLKSFQSLWQTIHGEDGWAENPWVWAVSFERVSG